MSRLRGDGITVDIPGGWEGRIYAKRRGPTADHSAAPQRQAQPGDPGLTNAVLHVASFAIPPGAGDYGGGAVEVMRNTDLLIVLMEHGPQSVGTALFATQGIPRLTVDDVSPTTLQRLIEGQAGAQKFFTVNDRAFCLYVVFGSYARRFRTLPLVNDIVRSIVID